MAKLPAFETDASDVKQVGDEPSSKLHALRETLAELKLSLEVADAELSCQEEELLRWETKLQDTRRLCRAKLDLASKAYGRGHCHADRRLFGSGAFCGTIAEEAAQPRRKHAALAVLAAAAAAEAAAVAVAWRRLEARARAEGPAIRAPCGASPGPLARRPLRAEACDFRRAVTEPGPEAAPHLRPSALAPPARAEGPAVGAAQGRARLDASPVPARRSLGCDFRRAVTEPSVAEHPTPVYTPCAGFGERDTICMASPLGRALWRSTRPDRATGCRWSVMPGSSFGRVAVSPVRVRPARAEVEGRVAPPAPQQPAPQQPAAPRGGVPRGVVSECTSHLGTKLVPPTPVCRSSSEVLLPGTQLGPRKSAPLAQPPASSPLQDSPPPWALNLWATRAPSYCVRPVVVVVARPPPAAATTSGPLSGL